MIDVEPQVFEAIATAVEELVPGISVSSLHTNTPPSLPHVSIEEADNYVHQGSIDSSQVEKADTLMYTVSVYTNDPDTRKSDAKKIAQTIDRVLYNLNFTRLSRTPVPNAADETIYRLVSRYTVITDGKFFYRR